MLLQILLLSFLATKVDSCTSSAFTTCITVRSISYYSTLLLIIHEFDIVKGTELTPFIL